MKPKSEASPKPKRNPNLGDLMKPKTQRHKLSKEIPDQNKTAQGVLGTGKGDFELLGISGEHVDVSKVDQRILTRVARVIHERIEVGGILSQPGQVVD
jgi:hypothetical protein